MSELKWRTKEGELIPISELGDRHLLNIYRMLDRQVCEIKEMTLFWMHPVWGPHGEKLRRNWLNMYGPVRGVKETFDKS